MVKQWTAVAAFVAVAAVSAGAQAGRQSEAEQVRARQHISTMEGVLERAVLNGADNLQRQLDAVMPNAATLTGEPQVRGFRLESYGVFFDVEVPALQLSIAWMVRSMPPGNPAAGSAIAELRSMAGRVDGAERDSIVQVIQRLEAALGLAPGFQQGGSRVSQRGTIGAATVYQPPSDNPNEAWTREVKSSLVEAMLSYSGSLTLGDDEWLTVAARDNVPANPLVAGDLASTTVIFRVKGSDLAAFHSRKLTMDEARKRVEVREY